MIGTWRDRLVRKLGPDFRVFRGEGYDRLTKRCEVTVWDKLQKGWIEVAITHTHNNDNTNPVLFCRSQADIDRLQGLLSNRWKLRLIS